MKDIYVYYGVLNFFHAKKKEERKKINSRVGPVSCNQMESSQREPKFSAYDASTFAKNTSTVMEKERMDFGAALSKADSGMTDFTNRWMSRRKRLAVGRCGWFYKWKGLGPAVTNHYASVTHSVCEGRGAISLWL